MRVLVAPDQFTGTLSAVEAAAAIADGWARQAPGDQLDQAPMTDGGPGFVDVLHAALGGELLAGTVPGPSGVEVPATLLRTGETVWLEAAQACGAPLVSDPERATTAGVGVLLRHAVEAGARRVVVGLGGASASDGGAGLLAALGATADADLSGGASGLTGITRLDPAPARAALTGVELVLASDVASPLTGMFGVARTSGPQQGIAEDRLPWLDGVLQDLAASAGQWRLSLAEGAGAAGGLGFALLALGGTRRSGVDLVAEAVDLPARARSCDLVVTGEGSVDFASRAGTVPYEMAALATESVRPCVALAGQVLVGTRELRALGIESAYAMDALVGEERAWTDPAAALADLAARVARTWSR